MTTATITKTSVRERRQMLGMTQTELVELSGISSGTIVRIENDQSTGVHYGVAWAIADALGVSIIEIDWPADLTHRGRPPKSGRPLSPEVRYSGDCCSACFIMKSLSGSCACT